MLGSIQPQPLQNLPDGTLDLAMVEAAIKPDDSHFAITRLLALENTIGGKVIGRDYLAKALTLAWKRGLSTHLDGARIFNAAVKLGMPVNALCAGFDTVSVCLSKGLGAPAGTVLVGHQGLVDKARRIRKMLGGGMRQIGILAAAAIHALAHHIVRLADDQALARRRPDGLEGLPGMKVVRPQTNIVFVEVEGGRGPALLAHLKSRGVLATGIARPRQPARLRPSPPNVRPTSWC